MIIIIQGQAVEFNPAAPDWGGKLAGQLWQQIVPPPPYDKALIPSFMEQLADEMRRIIQTLPDDDRLEPLQHLIVEAESVYQKGNIDFLLRQHLHRFAAPLDEIHGEVHHEISDTFDRSLDIALQGGQRESFESDLIQLYDEPDDDGT